MESNSIFYIVSIIGIIINILIIDYKLEQNTVKNVNIDINKIKILDSFKYNRPKYKKMKEKENYYLNNKKFRENIVLDNDNVLVDGYTTYLLAVKYKIKKIKVIKNMQ